MKHMAENNTLSSELMAEFFKKSSQQRSCRSTLSACYDKYGFTAADGDRAHKAIHLLVDRRKDRLARPLPDSMGPLLSRPFFPFLKILFSCSVVCPSLSFPMPSLVLTLKPARRHSGACYIPLLCLNSEWFSVRPSPL